MKMKHLLALLAFPLFSQAAPEAGVSAARKLNVPGSVYEKAFLKKNNTQKDFYVSAQGAARNFPTANLPLAASWDSMDTLQRRFEDIRDTRSLDWNDKPNFPRRIPWMYPDDGCYARAGFAVRHANRENYPTPNKVFAFGSLSVKSSNAYSGRVGWWYHVAPVVSVDGTNYVLDPSIEATRPLTVKEWLERMGDSSKMRVSICKSGTYTPGSDCSRTVTRSGPSIASSTKEWFLDKEYSRLKALGRNADSELGNNPPWE
jgi:hypothetical protein